MDASVRYAQSTDGTSIAYSTAGSGPPLVYLQPFSHQQLDASVPMLRDWYGRFSANRTLIRYDIRQFGLSQRGGLRTLQTRLWPISKPSSTQRDSSSLTSSG